MCPIYLEQKNSFIMPLYIWNGGSPLICPNIFGTEEVTKHDAITKKAGKFKFLEAQMVQTLPMGLAAPGYIWAEVRPSGRYQEGKTKP